MAQEDYFLKIDGIDGESLQKGHEKEIEISSMGWDVRNAGSFAGNMGGGSGKVTMRDFTFAMSVNKASPKLFLACCTGEHIKSATLTCRKAGKQQQEYLKWKFTDLLISGYDTEFGGTGAVDGHKAGLGGRGTGEGNATVPVDQIRFNFTKVEMSYAPQKADGSLGPALQAGFDLKQGVKV